MPILNADLVPVARQNMLPEGVVGHNVQPRRRRVKVRRPLALQLPPVSLQPPKQPLKSPSQPLQAPLQSLQPPSASLQAPLQPLAALQAPTATPFQLRPENRPFQVNETVGSKPEFAKRCELTFAQIFATVSPQTVPSLVPVHDSLVQERRVHLDGGDERDLLL